MAYDKTKPANNSALVSSEMRANFEAIEDSVSGMGVNLCSNGNLEYWNAGNAAAPDGFVLAGSGGTIARTGAGLADTFTFGAGANAAKITRSGNNVTLTWTVVATADMASFARLGVKRFGVGLLGKTSTASHLRVTINDGVGTSSSAYHTGGGSAEWLSIARTLDASMTKLEVSIEVNTTDAAAYVGGLVMMVGQIKPADWSLERPDEFFAAPLFRAGAATTFNVRTSGVITDSVDHTQRANGTTVETTLSTYSLPANALPENGRILRIVAMGSFASNANNKTLKVYFGGTNISLTLGATNGGVWMVEAYVVRTGAATQKLIGYRHARSSGVWDGLTVAAAPTETLTGAVTIKTTGQSDTASNDILQELFFVEAL